MSHLDSDLEEGEILDDSPPSPVINSKKGKELPRRYDVREIKNSIHKHKKDCKYAIRHHAKKLSKLKTTPKLKSTHNHKYTCSRKKSHKVPHKYSNSDIQKSLFSKNGQSFPQHSLIAEMQTSIKCLNINKVSTKSVYDKSQLKKRNTSLSKNDLGTFETKIQTLNTKTSKTDKSIISNEKSLNVEIPPDNADSKESKQHSSNDKEILGVMKPNIDSKNVIPNGSSETKEESEDEEELRRIALATCAKRKAITESTEDVHKSCNILAPKVSSTNDVQISHEISNPASDNYEVVDMEIDEDTEDSGEIIQTAILKKPPEAPENLFIIDTNPSVVDVGNKENSYLAPQAANNSSDEEFEADILRAELIESMYRKKYLQNEQLQKSKFSLNKKQKPIIPEKKFMVNYQRPNLSFRHKLVRTAKHTLRKNSINKAGGLKHVHNKAPLSVQSIKPPERIIIALNDESSSDESDKCEGDSIAENPVESIVALISDCRQKSDSAAETTKSSDVETKTAIPKALECLSKAQQEEYNSLMKILAEKKQLPVPQTKHPQKNGSLHSPLDDLKQLEGKLVGLKNTLKNKKVSVTSLSKDVNSKKLHYMKAKLSAQHLKEQLIAAEKVRKAKLLEWSGSCDHLKRIKQSVLNLENKIDQVQNLCNKIGSSVQGQSYILPILPPITKQS